MPASIQGHNFSSRQVGQLLSASNASEVKLSKWDKFKDLFRSSTKRAAVEQILDQLEHCSPPQPEEAARKVERFHALTTMADPEDRHLFSTQLSRPVARADGSAFQWAASFSVGEKGVGGADVVETKSLNAYRAAYTAEAVGTIAQHIGLDDLEAQRYIEELCSGIDNVLTDRKSTLVVFNDFFDKHAAAILDNPIASRVANDAATLLIDVTAPLPIGDNVQRLAKQDLRPGDLLLLVDEPEHTTFTHGAIKVGQTLAGMSALRDNCGDADLVHAVMWVKNPDNQGRTHANSAGEPEIAEVRGGNRLCAQNTALRTGRYVIYRPKDADLGDASAQIAMVWGDGRTIRYNTPASVMSIVSNSNFGKHAEEKVAL